MQEYRPGDSPEDGHDIGEQNTQLGGQELVVDKGNERPKLHSEGEGLGAANSTSTANTCVSITQRVTTCRGGMPGFALVLSRLLFLNR